MSKSEYIMKEQKPLGEKTLQFVGETLLCWLDCNETVIGNDVNMTHTQYTLNIGLMAGRGTDINLKATMLLLESSKLKLLVPLEL